MKKTGIKTFFCSFVFSLFAMFVANGAYLHAKKSNNREIKIPNKNITLFLKDLSNPNNNIQSAPTKKIALSILPDIKKAEEEIIVADKIPLSLDDYTLAETTQPTATETIPLQSTLPSKPLPSPKKGEKVIGNFDKIISSPPPVNEKELSVERISKDKKTSPANENKKQEQFIVPDKEMQVAAATSKETEPEILFLKEEDTPINTSQSLSNKEPLNLIPLEKESNNIKTAKNEVKSAADAENNQVALKAHNIPIKSMIKKIEEKKPENANFDSKWQSMEEKHSEKRDDNPWLVAKGVKFPRNEMVLTDKTYLQDEEEIKKLLATNNVGEDDKKKIKLASETVKNLLIPIPDDIMKEKNITPQLVSESKDKKTEEPQEGKDNINIVEQTKELEPETTEKKGGILNSITSMFSNKVKEIPQIGDTIISEVEETKNSLLTAFKRKKSQFSSKILPTEIRLSFQPNRAEISGQTLRWIRAFAQKTNEDPLTGLEIRIDGTSSPFLQRRRLNLLQNILINEGADYSKINTVFTAREPNSFILRTIRINNENINMQPSRTNRTNNNYMQW